MSDSKTTKSELVRAASALGRGPMTNGLVAFNLRVSHLIAIWLISGFIIEAGLVYYFLRDSAELTPWVPFQMGALVHVVVAWPILAWPWIVRAAPFVEASWGGYLWWVLLWFPVCMAQSWLIVVKVIQAGLPPSEVGVTWGLGGGVVIGSWLIGVAFVFPTVWLVPRILIRRLRPGAFFREDH